MGIFDSILVKYGSFMVGYGIIGKIIKIIKIKIINNL